VIGSVSVHAPSDVEKQRLKLIGDEKAGSEAAFPWDTLTSKRQTTASAPNTQLIGTGGKCDRNFSAGPTLITGIRKRKNFRSEIECGTWRQRGRPKNIQRKVHERKIRIRRILTPTNEFLMM
jgi:hypothetical protein